MAKKVTVEFTEAEIAALLRCLRNADGDGDWTRYLREMKESPRTFRKAWDKLLQAQQEAA